MQGITATAYKSIAENVGQIENGSKQKRRDKRRVI